MSELRRFSKEFHTLPPFRVRLRRLSPSPRPRASLPASHLLHGNREYFEITVCIKSSRTKCTMADRIVNECYFRRREASKSCQILELTLIYNHDRRVVGQKKKKKKKTQKTDKERKLQASILDLINNVWTIGSRARAYQIRSVTYHYPGTIKNAA